MQTELVIGVVAAIAAISAAAIGAPHLRRDMLGELQKLIEIHEALPAHVTEARAAAMRRIEQQISELDDEDVARRNPGGIALGIILAVLAGALTWLVILGEGWWWLASPIPLLLWLMAIISFAQNMVKVPRATNGQSLKYQQKRREKKKARG